MNYQTQKALKKRLGALGVVYSERKSNYSDAQVLVISDENQPEGIYLTEWNYDASLNETLLGTLIKWLEDRGENFECEYPGTFSIVLKYAKDV